VKNKIPTILCYGISMNLYYKFIDVSPHKMWHI